MKKFKTLPIEKMIVDSLKFRFNNPKIKVDDIMEWSTSESVVNSNLRDDEVKLFICDVYVAVKKSLDKTIK